MSKVAYTPKNAPKTAMKPGRVLIVKGGECRLSLKFGLYFDGSGNNLYMDDTANGGYSHSNVARLYKAAYDEKLNGLYRIYIPGVGTPFEDIGESIPHNDGGSQGKMGAERIRFAMLAIVNEVSRLLTGKLIVNEDGIAEAVKAESNYRLWKSRLTSIVRQSKQRPNAPQIDHVVLDIFGFSRGATEARSFVNQLLKHFCDDAGKTFCGIDLRLRFMGLFDTVASVGLADSFPGPFEGHQDWGDESLLAIPPQVEQCVHFVAGHEGRKSFPVDLVLRKDGTYPPNCIEVVYPGMHSDVGGGYGPNDQGKAAGGQGELLSQIALNDMYERALKAGVALRRRNKLADARLENDFAISDNLKSYYETYLRAAALEGKALPAVAHYERHLCAYLNWRGRVLDEAAFNRLHCMSKQTSAQDKVNLTEANAQFRRYIARLERDETLEASNRSLHRADPRIPAQPVDTTGLRFYRKYWHRRGSFNVTQHVMDFFDRYMHDSRAGFTVVDPMTYYDHKRIHDRLRLMDATYQRELLDYEAYRRSRPPTQWMDPGGTPEHASRLPPTDPLTRAEREKLAIYNKTRDPEKARHYDEIPPTSDAAPGTYDDGAMGITDAIAAIDVRREGRWSYLHPRQHFAYSRVAF